MAALTDAAEKAILDHILGVAPMTAPAQVYLGLFTAAPGEEGGGTEVSGGGYARVAVGFSAAEVAADGPDAGKTVSTNTDEIRIRAEGGDFGTISHWALFDAATGGEMLIHAAFTEGPREYLDGDEVIIDAGALVVSAD